MLLFRPLLCVLTVRMFFACFLMRVICGHVVSVLLRFRHALRRFGADALLFCLDSRLTLLLLRCEVHDVTTFVIAARKTHVVRSVMSAAMGTHRERRGLKCMMTAAVLGVRPRMSHSIYHSRVTIAEMAGLGNM